MTAPKLVGPEQRENWCIDKSAEDTRRRLVQVAFEPHVQTNGKPAWKAFFFFEEVIVTLYLFGSLYRSQYFSGEKKKKLTQAGFPVVVGCGAW